MAPDILMFGDCTLKVQDENGGVREITKRLHYQVDDGVFTTPAAQIAAVKAAINNDIAQWVANTNVANVPRSYMGLVGCAVGYIIDSASVAVDLPNLSENGFLTGLLPAGQVAEEYRDHIESYEVAKDNGIGYMRFSAPEPQAIEAAIDIIAIQADFVFPILSYPAITAGLELANKFGEIITQGLKSDYKAK